MAEKVKVTLEFDGKNVQVLGQTNKQLDKLNKTGPKIMSALKVGAVAATGALVGLTAIVKKSLDAFGVQEKAVATLNQALKNQGNFSEAASKDLQNYASQLQRVTTFGDETILSSQSLIASFGFEGETLKRLTKATLDLAAAKGMDLRAAADLVSKAVGSSTNALTRYGVEIEGAAGSTARAQSAVENITALFGGQAQAQANTYSGAMKQMQNAIGDTMEVLGEEFAPIVKEVAILITDNIDVMKDFIRVAANVTRAVVKWFSTYDEWIDKTRSNFEKWFDENEKFNDFFQKFVIGWLNLVDKQGKKAEEFVNQQILGNDILAAERRATLADIEKTNEEAGNSNKKKITKIDADEEAWFIKNKARLQKAFDIKRQLLLKEQLAQRQHWTFLLVGAQLNAAQRTAIDRTLEDSFSNLASLMSSKSKTLFEIGKAASIARVTVSTITGAIEAITSTAALGPVGWVLGAIKAASITAAGALAVSNIASTQMPAAQFGGITTGPTIAGEAGREGVIPLEGEGLRRVQQAVGVTGAGQTGNVINVNIENFFADDESLPRRVAETIDKEMEDLRRLKVSQFATGLTEQIATS